MQEIVKWLASDLKARLQSSGFSYRPVFHLNQLAARGFGFLGRTFYHIFVVLFFFFSSPLLDQFKGGGKKNPKRLLQTTQRRLTSQQLHSCTLLRRWILASKWFLFFVCFAKISLLERERKKTRQARRTAAEPARKTLTRRGLKNAVDSRGELYRRIDLQSRRTREPK